MRVKVFKAALIVFTILTVRSAGFAQQQKAPAAPVNPKVDQTIVLNLDDLNKDLNVSLKNLDIKLNNIGPQINMAVNKISKNVRVKVSSNVNIKLNGLDDLNLNLENIAPQIDLELNTDQAETHSKAVKYKSYSKSYPIDGNDRIKLSNQYGRITVNTWDRHEMKVDVQIKAEATDDNEAQKLLDGVQIRDSKEGDQVSFRTSIEPNNNNGFKLFNWGNNKKHKLEINYTVYMPSHTDLNVEDSYGSIVLPDLQGRVRISSSYGSVTAENLTNSSNQIEGSYGSLKVGMFNGGHVDYSYGSVEIGECNNLKAGLSYGSVKLGKLTGATDLDLSYVSGFKIGEVGEALKRLNINATYSGISLGMPGNNNFNFDITTTYGGFNYNDDKVIITTKIPADGSKHYSSTKNYKGHFGKGNTEAQVNIRSTYGSVNFE
jgi:hypothetical protein